ncbi:MAG: hypothetical protein ACPHN2_08565 [Sinimarinibacterium flocculans]|uniref:hypothetical protein n=1 Tax=Sinimarinibacterium flocculans TaxID=985250 RepID=UPI003C48DD4D
MGTMEAGNEIAPAGVDTPVGVEVRFPGVSEEVDTIYAVSAGLTVRQGLGELGALANLAEAGLSPAVRDDPDDQRLRGVLHALSAIAAIAASLHRGINR